MSTNLKSQVNSNSIAFGVCTTLALVGMGSLMYSMMLNKNLSMREKELIFA
jgi:hypothetical protein